MFLVAVSTLAIIGMWTAAGLSALSAARTARTPQGAMGWVVFLMALPVLAIPAYMFFGHHRFNRYRAARRQAQALVQGLRRSTAARPAPDTLGINPAPLEAVAGLPVCRDNRVGLLIDGKETFDAIFAAMDAAQEYLLVQFYIVRDDALGRELRDRMIAAAQRGVAVWFMTDRIGSHALPRSYSAALAAAGVNLVDPATRRGPKHRFQINFRNHRKTVIADGRTGFTGGLNVGIEYLGQSPVYGPWRDTHLRLEGPAVLQLQLVFAEDWHWLTEEPLIDLLNWDIHLQTDGVPALIAATGPGDNTENGSMMYFSAIAAARERIWIASPYFVPDLDVVAALKNAALRGLDVRVLMPEMIDHHAPWLAAFSYFDDLRAAGVKVFRYTGGFMHQKVFLIDSRLSGVGTTNLDNRSFRLNFEAMALIFDTGFAQEVETMLAADFASAYELNVPLGEQKLRIRLGAPVARLFAPLL
jgi:cardiolipin synthase